MKKVLAVLIASLITGCSNQQENKQQKIKLDGMIQDGVQSLNNRTANLSVYNSPYATVSRNTVQSKYSNVNVAIYSPAPMTLASVLNIIENQYNIPTYISDAQSLGEANVAELTVAKRVSFKGNLIDFMHYLGKVFGVHIVFDKNNQINVSYFQTKTYSLNQFIDGNKASASLTVGGTEGTGSGLNARTESTVESNTWQEIESYLNDVIGDNGSTAILPDFSLVKVTARPWVIANVDQLFERLKSESEMQVAVHYKIISLSTNKLDQLAASFGLNIQGDQFTVASKVVDAITQSKVGGSVGFESQGVSGKLDAIVQSIGQNVISEGQFVGLPNRIMPINLTTTQSYVSGVETQVNNQVNTETRSVKTEQLKTGLSMLILPKILDDGRIQLTSGFTEKKLVNLNKAGDVQLPVVDEKETLSTVTLDSGSIDLISLYSGNTNNSQSALQFLGGGYELQNQNQIIAIILGATSYKTSANIRKRGQG